MTAAALSPARAAGLSDFFYRRSGLLTLALILPPLLWIGIVYIGSLFALLLQSFYSLDEFSGLVVHEFTLSTYGHLFSASNLTIILRTVVMALVEPVAQQVQFAEGGDDYVRILAHLVSHPELDPREVGAGFTPVNRRMNMVLVAAMPPLPRAVLDLRLELLVSLLFHGLAGQARMLADHRVGERRKRLFVENLVDTIEATLAAPPSAVTARLAGRRTARL